MSACEMRMKFLVVPSSGLLRTTFSCFCFCYFSSLATYSVMSVLVLLVFHKCVAAYSLVSEMTSTEFSRRTPRRLVHVFFVDGFGLFFKNFTYKICHRANNPRKSNTRLLNASANVDDFVQRSMLQLRTSCSAPFCTVSVKTFDALNAFHKVERYVFQAFVCQFEIDIDCN